MEKHLASRGMNLQIPYHLHAEMRAALMSDESAGSLKEFVLLAIQERIERLKNTGKDGGETCVKCYRETK